MYPVTCLILMIASSFSAAVFLHEKSLVTIQPHEEIKHSDFGFSLGFQLEKENLVVGAPSADLKGKVYSCNMTNVSDSEEITCRENGINFSKLQYNLEPKTAEQRNQHFYTGASISVTSKQFATCAPLWTTNVPKKKRLTEPDTVGTCFIFNEDDQPPERYNGLYEQFMKNRRTGRSNTNRIQEFTGGIGFSTLADEDNDLLIIAKESREGDLVYTSINKSSKNKPSKGKPYTVKSMVKEGGIQSPTKYSNIGNAMIAGKFFDPEETVYAFSMRKENMHGIVEFLKYNSDDKKLSMMNPNSEGDHTIESEAIGSMFGAALEAVDINKDGLDELLVGAPAQSERNCVECGALHIYLGGDLKTMGKKHFLEIKGTTEFGRFGTAIAARDIDGDKIPEIVVSAPYEDNGLGAVYILSGYNVQNSLVRFTKDQVLGHLLWSDLKSTQRITKENFRNFGYSLQFVQDVDGNGCNELVAGSPGSGKAVLFKCLQNIKITLSSVVAGDQPVKEQDSNFTVKVCADVKYPKKPTNIVANLTIINDIIGGGTSMLNSEINLDISCNDCPETQSYCDTVTIELTDKEPRDFVFTSQAKIDIDYILNSAVLNPSWVVASPDSLLTRTLEVPRHCKGNDCIPKLSMEIFWSGNNSQYVLGSSAIETVTLRVRNDGNSSYEACVKVFVDGAPLSRLDCPATGDLYQCDLPRPLRRDTEHSINLVLNMTELTNQGRKLQIKAMLHESCSREASSNKALELTYNFPTDGVHIYGISQSRNVTDKQILDKNIAVLDSHEYTIINNGSIHWKNLKVKIWMDKKPFTKKFKVSMANKNCEEANTDEAFSHVCSLNLLPNSTVKISATTEILKSVIQKNLINGKLNTSSSIEFYMIPTSQMKFKSISTVLTYQKELTIANNKWMIAGIAATIAALILIVIAAVLYKYGFFKREEKMKLHVLRESIKQRNSRRNTHISSAADGQGLQMDVDDDCPFDPVPLNKEINFVETTAQVHS